MVSDSGFAMQPTYTFADAAAGCDVLFVPGGAGTALAIADSETVDYLARAGADARYVTSVCSGSLVLGAAGLLNGYRAGCRWSARSCWVLSGPSLSLNAWSWTATA